MEYDVAVIGGGPGGYVAAIRAAQLGARVLLVEKEKLGGVCLNRGCIPTKTLLKSAEKWQELKRCGDFGLQAENIGFDFAIVTARKNQVVAQLHTGVSQLVKNHDIEVVYGKAALESKNRLNVVQAGEIFTYSARKIILATGSVPMRLPVAGGDLPGVLDSDQLLSMTFVPRRMVVVGAGAVGIEFAAIFQAFGCDVTVVEMLPSILPNLDSDLSKRMGLILRKLGIKMLAGTKVTAIRPDQGGLVVTLENERGPQEIATDRVLAATGRQPLVEDLGLENAGLDVSLKGVIVNQRMETTVEGIYAVGDLTGCHMWAHAASAAGIVAAENALGGYAVMDYSAIPGCIFTTPEIAVVGLTEQEASLNRQIRVSRFNFAANGKAVSMGESDGLVKIIADAADGKVLGMHILGPHASDLIMEGAIAIRNGLTAKAIAHTIHPHPSLSEAVMESAHGIDGEMIHQAKLKPGGCREPGTTR